MSKQQYDDDELTYTNGSVVSVKKNVKKEKADGGTFKAHVLKIEDKDGEEHTFTVSTRAAAAEYIAKLKLGEEVGVKHTDDKKRAVVAVFKSKFGNKGRKGGYSGAKKEHDPTGSIQGNTRSNAAALVAAGVIDVKDGDVKAALIEAAKVLIEAGKVQDELVAKAVKKAKDDDDDDSDEATDEDSDDEDTDDDTGEDTEDSDDSDDDEAPKKKRSKKSKDSPY